MGSVTFSVDDNLILELKKFTWINLSNLIKLELISRLEKSEKMLEKLEEDQKNGFIDWSVDLGKNAKKESFKKIFLKLSDNERKKILDLLPPKKRKELSK